MIMIIIIVILFLHLCFYNNKILHVHIHVYNDITICRLDTLHHQLLIMQEEHKRAIQKTLSAEDRAQKMDQLLAQEEATVQQLEKELAIKREKKFKQSQQLQEVKRRKQNIEAEIQVEKYSNMK